MSEYKETLNLPHTDFPMKANLAKREPDIQALWEKSGIYKQIRTRSAGRATFILHDGPPYANGHLHCGHALNKILKDIIIKSKSFSGYDAPFRPGWDCHGLPIELNVEKKAGKAGVKISAQAFRQKCRDYAASQIDIQRSEFQRLGIFGDWQNPYTTMDYAYEANIIRALAKMVEHGHLKQGFKPVHWCIDCGSALAEAEVDYEEKSSFSIDVAFMAKTPELFIHKIDKALPKQPVIVPIWTTTPWTLPANQAVCLHPMIEYVLVDDGARYFLVAAELVQNVMERYDLKSFSIKGALKGSEFEHLTLLHPLMVREVPVVLGDHVTIDAGTGCVHTAPAHGPEDYLVGKRYALPLNNPVLGNGCYAETVPGLAGVHVFKADEPIMRALMQSQALLSKGRMQHSYPHCWRHKTPVIFLATPQWFISMEEKGLRKALLALVETVDWIPEWGKARIQFMIENRPDWCISRQRAWGTPMPLFIHKSTRALHPNTVALLGQVADYVQKQGIDAWFDLEASVFLGEEAEAYEKVTDTLDVWFDAGVSHFCVLKQDSELAFPADLYLEGSDQHRGWFNASLTTAAAMYGKAPYRAVLTHGYTVDAAGKKLSKSSGNYVALDKLVKQYGADILRLWVASTDYRYEVSISDEIIKRNADAYRRIRNTARFLLSNLFDFDPARHLVATEELVELDQWAITRASELQEAIIEAYDRYQFHIIYQKIHNFCAVDMGSFYLDIIKDRQYTTPVDSQARRSCQTAMYHIIQALTRWLAPVLSFTAEELWAFIPGVQSSSVFLESWYTDWPTLQPVPMNDWQTFQAIRNEVNKALELKRQEGLIGSSLAAQVTLYAEEPVYASLMRLGAELRFLLITSSAVVLPLKEAPADIPCNHLGIAIKVEASPHEKCVRCWHRRSDVGENESYPGLCKRCVGNVSGEPEVRQFA